ncbi:MAG: 30S ribosomal protein S14 [Candidatus Paracaedibacteraceae bacterium]|nr:30S ribosomal protein S14 [Candidatus Paracaedibacteraceae bacterium]
MARKGSIEINEKRKRLAQKYASKRAELKAIAADRNAAPEERFKATLKLAEMPRSGAKIRVRNRCMLTGRSRGNYRKFGISRIMLREMGSLGLIPGLKKASW